MTHAPAFKAVVFDLDGTLIDTRPGITASVAAAVAAVDPGREVPPLDGLLGRPLDGLMVAVAPDMTVERRGALAAVFREHYDSVGWRVGLVYPGVPETLTALRGAGVRLFVVTNKRRMPALAILEAADLGGHFEAVYTPDSRVPVYEDKGAMGLACLADSGLAGHEVVVVGDSVEDIEMARRCGAVCAVAAWGFGDAVDVAGERKGTSDHPGTPSMLTALDSMSELLTLVGPGRRGEAGNEP